MTSTLPRLRSVVRLNESSTAWPSLSHQSTRSSCYPFLIQLWSPGDLTRFLNLFSNPCTSNLNSSNSSLCMCSSAYNSLFSSSLKWVTCHGPSNRRNRNRYLNRNSFSIQSICRLRQHHSDRCNNSHIHSHSSQSTVATRRLLLFQSSRILLGWRRCTLRRRQPCPR